MRNDWSKDVYKRLAGCVSSPPSNPPRLCPLAHRASLLALFRGYHYSLEDEPLQFYYVSVDMDTGISTEALAGAGAIRRSTPINMLSLHDALSAAALCPPYHGLSQIEHKPTATVALQQASRAEVLRRIAELERELRASYTIANAGVPINRLPEELLIKIFSHTQDVEDYLVRYPCYPGIKEVPWLNILQVCRHWFTVASNAPTLWRTLCVESSVTMLRTGLLRSKSAGLTLVTSQDSPHDRRSVLPKVFDLVMPHTSRLQSVHFLDINDGQAGLFISFMENDFPMLNELHANFIGTSGLPHSGLDLSLNIVQNRFPRLRQVHLHGVQCLDGPSGILPQLQELQVEFRDPTPKIATTHLLTALGQMKDAKKVVLCNLRVTDTFPIISGLPPVLRPRVVLERANEIWLDCPHGDVVRHVLESIAIPLTAQAALYFPCDSVAYRDIRRVLPNDRSGLPVISSATDVTIDAYCEEIGVKGSLTNSPSDDSSPSPEGVVGCFELRQKTGSGAGFTVEEAVRAVSHCLDVFHGAPIVRLRVRTTGQIASRMDWKGVLETYPRLQCLQLEIFGPSDSVMEREEVLLDPSLLFPVLNPGDTEDDEEQGSLGKDDIGLLAPHLGSIRISGTNAGTEETFQRVAECLENRKKKLRQPEWRLEKLEWTWVKHWDGAYFLEMKAACETALAPLVAEVIYSETMADP
ncbi:hypothetical protein C8Q78DRAFT_276691 [Trametes maxima]|nr:hypothetical protein C8Q78DRAFT_276691 [Trametes maxima]